MFLRPISTPSSIYAKYNRINQHKNNSAINFKQQLKDNKATSFIDSFNKTQLVADEKTNGSVLVTTNADNKVVQEIHIGKNGKPTKMIERHAGENIKETIYESDGTTIKEQKEFSEKNEAILLKHLTYTKDNYPLIQEFNEAGTLIKETEGTMRTDGIVKFEFDIIRTFDENHGRILKETTNAGLPILKRTKEFFYDENNKLVKMTEDARDELYTSYYDEDEKIIEKRMHIYTQEEKPEAYDSPNRYPRDTYTVYLYNDDKKLIRSRLYNSSNGRLMSGTKYDPKTGKEVVYASDRGTAIIYDKDEKPIISRNDNTTCFYDEKTHLPYRIDKKGGTPHTSVLYEQDAGYYNANTSVNPKKKLSVTFSNISDRDIDAILPSLNGYSVKSITKDLRENDSDYDTYTLKIRKNSPYKNGYFVI